jgi:hypothetical protein
VKVYYDIPDTYLAMEELFPHVLQTFPKEMRDTVKPLLEANFRLQEQLTIAFFKTKKFETMWRLRVLEKEINREGGMIIITISGIDIKGFSDELWSQIVDFLI